MSQSLASILAAAFLLAGSAWAQTPSPWGELARNDLAAIREALLENHPGPVDPLNPGYRTWLDDGYEAALAMTDEITSLDGHLAVLRYYTSGFDDGHIGFESFHSRSWVRWPRFTVALRQGRFFVDHVDRDEDRYPSVGDEVLSCDGVQLEERLATEVMPYDGAIPSLEASRTRSAPYVLVDAHNPFWTRPSDCLVRDTSGTERTIELGWWGIARETVRPLLERAVYGPAPGFGVREMDDETVWISLPTFSGGDRENVARLEALSGQMPTFRDHDLIVLDVRGNTGGSSGLAYSILQGLYGEAYGDYLYSLDPYSPRVEWRASESNADFIETSTLPRFTPGSSQHRYVTGLIATLRDAAASGRDLVDVDGSSGDDPKEALPEVENPVSGTVVLLTDGWCGSACLDFADQLLPVPGVVHLGTATFADAVYIDNQGIVVPSQLGVFGFSMKVWRDRPRAHNQPYLPAIAYPGLTFDTELVEAWVLETARAVTP